MEPIQVHPLAATTVFAVLGATGADLGRAESTASGNECSPLVENRADCQSTIWTFPHQLGKPLGGLTLSADVTNKLSSLQNGLNGLNPALTSAVILDKHGKPVPPPPEPFPVQLLRDFTSYLQAIVDGQDKAQARILEQNQTLNDITREVASAQKYIPRIDHDSWIATDRGQFMACVQHIITRLDGQPANGSDALACKTSDDDTGRKSTLKPLPSADINRLKIMVGDLQTRYDTLQKNLKGTFLQIPPGDDHYTNLMDEITDRQDALAELLKSAQTNRATLTAYKEQLTRWQIDAQAHPDLMVRQSVVISRYYSPLTAGQQTASVKLTDDLRHSQLPGVICHRMVRIFPSQAPSIETLRT